MPNQNSSRQAGQYDKIIKENLEVTLPVIIRDVLGLDIVLSEELPDDVQHTKERKPDALKKVTDAAGILMCCKLSFKWRTKKKWSTGWQAILANFGKEHSYQAIKSIEQQIKSTIRSSI